MHDARNYNAAGQLEEENKVQHSVKFQNPPVEADLQRSQVIAMDGYEPPQADSGLSDSNSLDWMNSERGNSCGGLSNRNNLVKESGRRRGARNEARVPQRNESRSMAYIPGGNKVK